MISENWHLVAPRSIRLRPYLTLKKQCFRGDTWYVLSDPYTNKFYRFRPASYKFIARLDGRRNIEGIWKLLLESDPANTPSQREVMRILSQLSQNSLILSDKQGDSHQLFEQQRREKNRNIRAQLSNPLFVRIPLWDPDRFLLACRSLNVWLLSRLGGLVWLIVVGLGLKVAVDHAGPLFAQSQGVVSPGNLLLLYLTWALVKVIHEMGHAFACRRFGGEVHTMGIMLLIFTPIPYMDATAAWGFRERWKRVLVGASGMMAEVFVAAVGVFIWASTGPEVAAHQIAYNVIFLASVSTVLFNLNPLLRFDGYYILCDLLDTPNLHQQSVAQLRYFLERYIFGLRGSTPVGETPREQFWLSAFALASGFYRIFVFAAILLFVADQFFGLGLILAAIGLVSFLIMPVFKFLRYLVQDQTLETKRQRVYLTMGGFTLALLGFLVLCPFPHYFRATGVVHSAQTQEVFNLSEGHVYSVQVDSGASVEETDVLTVLGKPELRWQLDSIKTEQDLIKARMRLARESQPGYLRPLLRSLSVAESKEEVIEQQLNDLNVRANASGIWIAPYLDSFQGALVSRGTKIGTIVDSSKFYFSAIVTQSDSDRLFEHTLEGSEIKIYGQSGQTIEGGEIKIVPTEQKRLPTASLGWSAGGALRVSQGDEQGLQTVEPFFEVRIELPAQSRVELYHLRSGVVRFDLPPEPILSQAWRSIRQMLQRRYKL